MQNLINNSSTLKNQDYIEKLIDKIYFQKKRTSTIERLLFNNRDKFDSYHQSLKKKYPDFYLYQAEEINGNNLEYCQHLYTDNVSTKMNNINTDNNFSTNPLIKKIYKRLVLIFHPDKIKTNNNNEDLDTKITNNDENSENSSPKNLDENLYAEIKGYYDEGDMLSLLKICKNNQIEICDDINTDDVIVALESQLYHIKQKNSKFNVRLDYLYLMNDYNAIENNEKTIAKLLDCYVISDRSRQSHRIHGLMMKKYDDISAFQKEERRNNINISDLKDQLRNIKYTEENNSEINELKHKISNLKDRNKFIKSEIEQINQKISNLSEIHEKIENSTTRAEIQNVMNDQNTIDNLTG